MVYFTIVLDLAMIGLLLVGINYAVKLTQQLAEMRAGRNEMERFVAEFNSTVTRAESGVRGLKTAARSCGDDLEKLIERGQLLRDELHFLTESADQVASRISNAATSAARPVETPAPMAAPRKEAEIKELPRRTATANPQTLAQEIKNTLSASGKMPSAAERELLSALEKLG